MQTLFGFVFTHETDRKNAMCRISPPDEQVTGVYLWLLKVRVSSPTQLHERGTNNKEI